MIRAIFAVDEKCGIGKKNQLPWAKNSEDLKWFKECTDAQAIVMGRNTWESLPVKPLPNRKNIIVSNTTKALDEAEVVSRDIYKSRLNVIAADMPVWIIGGSVLFGDAIDIVDELWISRIKGDFQCDTFLNKQIIEENFELYSSGSKNGLWIEKRRRIK